MFPLLRIRAQEGRHILQNGVFPQVVFDDLGHISVDRLVIGDARSRSIGQCHATRPDNFHQVINAQTGIGTETFGIDEVIIDSTINHIHPLEPLCGVHVDVTVIDDQVSTLYQFDSHLLSQEGVFKVSRIINARRQHNRCRMTDTFRSTVE